jgi:hypothetical protein
MVRRWAAIVAVIGVAVAGLVFGGRATGRGPGHETQRHMDAVVSPSAAPEPVVDAKVTPLVGAPPAITASPLASCELKADTSGRFREISRELVAVYMAGANTALPRVTPPLDRNGASPIGFGVSVQGNPVVGGEVTAALDVPIPLDTSWVSQAGASDVGLTAAVEIGCKTLRVVRVRSGAAQSIQSLRAVV